MSILYAYGIVIALVALRPPFFLLLLPVLPTSMTHFFTLSVLIYHLPASYTLSPHHCDSPSPSSAPWRGLPQPSVVLVRRAHSCTAASAVSILSYRPTILFFALSIIMQSTTLPCHAAIGWAAVAWCRQLRAAVGVHTGQNVCARASGQVHT